MVNDANR